MRGWAAHCASYPDADPTYIGRDDLSVAEIAMGQCLRDGEPIT